MLGRSRRYAQAVHIAEVLTHRTHPTSGVFGAVTELSAALADAGNRVDLWVPRAWPQSAADGVEALRSRGVHVEVVPASSLVDAARRIARNVGASGCDVAHLHNGFTPMNNLVARALDLPYIVTTHGVYATESLRHHAWRKQLAARVTERPMLRRAAAVTALTAVEAAELQSLAPGVDPVIAPLGFAEHSATETRDEFRSEVGVRPSERLAVFGGRMDVRAKRLDHLVAGVADAPGWRLVLIGGDYDGGRSALAEVVHGIGVSDRVVLLEQRSGAAYRAVLAAADVNVLVSQSEGLPRCLIEGMLAGVPALVSPEVDQRISVGAAGSGWVSGPNEIGETLCRIAEASPEELAATRRRARDHGSRYLWDAVIDRWIEVFEGATSTRD